MKKNKAQKSLEYVGRVYMTGFKYTKIMRELLASGCAECKEKEWRDPFKSTHKDIYPLDLSKNDVWSTFNKCVELELSAKPGCVSCIVYLYDGDNMYGDQTNMRWKATFSLKPSSLKHFKDEIGFRVQRKAREEYANKIQRDEDLWIKEHLVQIGI